MRKQTISMIVAVGLLTATGCASQRVATKKSSEPINRREAVHFDFGKAKVRSQDRSTLDKVASWIKRDKKTVGILEGHTDQIGSDRYNEILGENRARAVRVYLRDQGADPRRVTVVSKGKKEPVVKGRGRKALGPNRRVEILMTLTGSE